ncbi:MAG: hypothetical protein RJB57_585 [Actinomycetota bacterium]
MKVRKFLAGFAGTALLLGFAPGEAGAARKATVKVVLTGDCADGEHVEDADEDDCSFLITVTPKSKNVSAVVEVAYDEEEPDWEEYDSGRTRGGRLMVDIAATDEDGVWMDGVVRYRVVVKKAAGVTVPKMRDYKVEYISAEAAEGDEELAEEMAEDKEFNQEMDQAQSENNKHIQQQQPNADIRQGKQGGAPQGGFNKSGEFNRACGSIGFPADKCQQLVEVKTPKDALAILGDKAEAWCNALAAPMGRTIPCAMVLPNVFPPF